MDFFTGLFGGKWITMATVTTMLKTDHITIGCPNNFLIFVVVIQEIAHQTQFSAANLTDSCMFLTIELVYGCQRIAVINRGGMIIGV